MSNIKIVINGNCSVVPEQYILGPKKYFNEQENTGEYRDLYTTSNSNNIGTGIEVKFTETNDPIKSEFIGWFVFPSYSLYSEYLECGNYDDQEEWLREHDNLFKSSNSVYVYTVTSSDEIILARCADSYINKSKLGDVKDAIGREYTISVSNIPGKDLLTNSSLRENNIIISSPVIEDEFYDIGTYSLLMTDSQGNAVRLSYTIKPGNGLHIEQSNDNTDDYLRMAIDSIDEAEHGAGSICSENDILYVNKWNIIDAYTLTVNTSNSNKIRGEIAVVTAHLDPAMPTTYGIAKGDEFTTYINPDIPGQIIVNTQNLETVDDKSNRDGIVKHSSEMNRTIEAIDGKLTVLTYNLDKASGTTFGVVKVDDDDPSTEPTILSQGGVISVNTHALDKATNDLYGIAKGDEITTYVDPNTPGQIKVNTQNLEKAVDIDDINVSSDTGSFGVVKPDGKSMHSYNGILSVNRFTEIEALLKTNNPEHEVFREDIEDLKNRVAKLETSAAAEEIEMFVHVGETTTTLPKPVYNKQDKKIEEYSDKKTIPFLIKTNCKFNVKVEYEFNENPQINLIYVQLGDGQQIPGSNLGNYIFESTGNSTSTLNLTFAIKNYNKNENVAFVNTQAIVTVASINDSAIKQSSFHIFKRWNNNSFIEPDDPQPQKVDGKLDENSFMIVYPTTSKVTNAGSSSSKELSYDGLSNGNQYFNIETYATYYTIKNDGSITNSGVGDYTMQLDYDSIENSSVINCGANWLTYGFTANYSNTQKFNVITSASKKVDGHGLVDSRRSTDINYRFNPGNNLSIPSDISSLKQGTDVLTLINTMLTSPDHNEVSTNFNILKTTALNTIRTTTSLNYEVYFSKTSNKFNCPKTKQSLKDILNSRFTEYDNIMNNYTLFNDSDYQSKSIKDKETIYTKENIVLKLCKSIIEEYNLFINILDFIREHQTSDTEKSVSFEYIETLKTVQPRVTVSSEISKNTTGIKFTVTRTKDSILSGSDWGVNLKYNFVDNKGHLVNTNGSTDNIVDYTYDLKSQGGEESFTKTFNDNNVSSAQSGVYNSTDSVEKFCDTMSINIEIVGEAGGDWLAFGGKNDHLRIRTQRYSWETNTKTSGKSAPIPIDLYAIMKNNNGNQKSYNLRNGVWYNDGYYRVDIDEAGWGKYGLLYLSFSSNGTSIANTNGIKDSVYYKYAYKVNTAPTDASSYKKSKGYESIPVQKSNNIAGIKIKEVSIMNGSFVFQNLTNSYTIDNPGNTITVISTGSWITSSTSNSTNYTFGDAYISNIKISGWDDISMTVTVDIKPGRGTNIPSGSIIINIPSSSGGKTNFIFLQNSYSYEYTQLYNNFSCSTSPWNSTTGCTVTYRLFNNYSLQRSSDYNEATILYSSESNTLISVYTESPIKYAEKNTTRNATYKNVPLLDKITGIKLWICLGCQTVSLSKNFQASSGASTDKIILSNATYKNGGSKSVSIKNALDSSSSILLIK